MLHILRFAGDPQYISERADCIIDFFFLTMLISHEYWSSNSVQKYDTIRIFLGFGNLPGRKACRNPGCGKFSGYGNYPGYGS